MVQGKPDVKLAELGSYYEQFSVLDFEKAKLYAATEVPMKVEIHKGEFRSIEDAIKLIVKVIFGSKHSDSNSTLKEGLFDLSDKMDVLQEKALSNLGGQRQQLSEDFGSMSEDLGSMQLTKKNSSINKNEEKKFEDEKDLNN